MNEWVANGGYVFYGARGIPLTKTSVGQIPPWTGDLETYRPLFARWSRKFLNWTVTLTRAEMIGDEMGVAGDGVAVYFSRKGSEVRHA